jgi:hypothetical protein
LRQIKPSVRHHERTGRFIEQTSRNTSEEPFAQAAVAVCSGHDQIGIKVLRYANERKCGTLCQMYAKIDLSHPLEGGVLPSELSCFHVA